MVVAAAVVAAVGGGVGTAAVAANSAKGSTGGERVSSLHACRHNLRAPLVFASPLKVWRDAQKKKSQPAIFNVIVVVAKHNSCVSITPRISQNLNIARRN